MKGRAGALVEGTEALERFGPMPESHVARRDLPRILLVVDGLYPSNGGTELQVKLLSEAFLRRGHDVQVLAPWLHPDRPRVEYVRGVKVTRLWYPRIRGLGAIFLMARLFVWLLVHRREYDAVHVHMVKNLATTMGMARPFLRNKVMAAKISGAWEFEGGVLDPALRERFPYSLMNHFIRKLDYFQTISEFTRERLLEAGYPPERICMIPNGLPVSRFECSARRAARDPALAGLVTLSYAGRLERVKGVDVLIRAAGELARRGVDGFRLLIAGQGRELKALQRLVARLGLDRRVTFLGQVRDMPAFMADSDIYVQPSNQEGLPNSVMQAMAASLPVVATRVSGNVDLVSDGRNGFLTPPGDHVAMADALQRLIADGDLRLRYGRASLEAVRQKYALDTVLDQLAGLYQARSA